MKIHGATALVTGANRGLGRHLAQQLRDRGATVYAAARDVASVDLDGVTPLALDITDPASVQAAARATGGVTLLVNNAGIARRQSLLHGDVDAIRSEFDTNVFGLLDVVRAFAPQLGSHPESYVLNVLSVQSWRTAATLGGYSASKSAAWSVTNGLRQELAAQGTRVAGLHVGFIDTDLADFTTAPKADPADVARIALDGIEADETEILADDVSRTVRAALAGGVGTLYPDVA